MTDRFAKVDPIFKQGQVVRKRVLNFGVFTLSAEGLCIGNTKRECPFFSLDLVRKSFVVQIVLWFFVFLAYHLHLYVSDCIHGCKG